MIGHESQQASKYLKDCGSTDELGAFCFKSSIPMGPDWANRILWHLWPSYGDRFCDDCGPSGHQATASARDFSSEAKIQEIQGADPPEERGKVRDHLPNGFGSKRNHPETTKTTGFGL